MLKLWTNVFKPLSSNRGQGVIEYILVLFVTVGLILGLMYQFNDAFRKYAQNYFGDYLACLLETGELPGLGSADLNSVCAAEFVDFSIENGKPLIGAGFGGSGSDKDLKDQSNSKSSKSSEGADSGSGQYVSQSPSRSGSRFSSSGQSGRYNPSDSSFGKKGKGIYTGSSDTSIPDSALNKGSSSNVGVNMDGGFYIQRENQEEDRSDNANKIAVKNNSAKNKQLERMRVNRKPAAAAQPDADVGFTLGNFLRFLLIAAIVIALVIFLGGQFMQISKSMD